MSFGFGVGDFIATINLAKKIRRRLIDSPKEFRAAYFDVVALSNTLRDLEDVMEGDDLEQSQKTCLDDIAGGCRAVLEDLDAVLNKYQILGKSSVSVSDRVRRIWKKLDFEPDDVKDLRARLTSSAGLLNAFYGSSTSKGVNRLVRHQDAEHANRILDWLSSENFDIQLADVCQRRQPGTGKWALESSQYNDWVNQSNNLLFCPGIPGAGKTIISSVIIDDLHSKIGEDTRTGVCYFFFNYKRQTRQRFEHVLATFIAQLARRSAPLPKILETFYNEHKKRQPSTSQYLDVLVNLIAGFTDVYIVIDAVDECANHEQARSQLLEGILALQSRSQLKLLITSRFIPEVTRMFENVSQLEIRAHEIDVEQYLRSQVVCLAGFVRKDPSLQEQICTTIATSIDGMFLLAKLYIDSLRTVIKPKQMKTFLRDLNNKRLTGDHDALEKAYQKARETIEDQPKSLLAVAKQVISWITYAKEPLTMAQLQHAIAAEDEITDLDDDSESVLFESEQLIDSDDILSVCAGLVTIDDHTEELQFVHYTTQEYFERIGDSWMPNAVPTITRACLTYLNNTAFSTGGCIRQRDFRSRVQHYPFLMFASSHWGLYLAEAASHDTETHALQFLTNQGNVLSSIQALKYRRVSWIGRYDSQSSSRPTGLHLAAYFGLETLVQKLLDLGMSHAVRDHKDRTPLSWAARGGRETTVRLLIAQSGIETDSRDFRGQTPLSRAASHGHRSVVELLSSRDDVAVNSRDNVGRTPLILAALRGRKQVVDYLLARTDVDYNARDLYDGTALSESTLLGHEGVVISLASRPDIEVNTMRQNDETPLFCALRWNKETMIKPLLSRKDIDLELGIGPYRSHLWHAARRGNETAIELLLAREDVDVNFCSNSGQTPLCVAIIDGHPGAVQLLLSRHDIDANLADSRGQTPLWWAIFRERESIVRLLLGRQEVVQSLKNDSEHRLLTLAEKFGNAEIVKLLREQLEDQSPGDLTETTEEP